ncbi:MAG: hypothetical protein ACTH4U_15850 [Pseudoalteromonas prydzensis]|uniref:hypothetical protein n=1 Tax=Pseudoalteromonas prydzensis TaxID=182141 RepID=UPI003F94A17D
MLLSQKLQFKAQNVKKVSYKRLGQAMNNKKVENQPASEAVSSANNFLAFNLIMVYTLALYGVSHFLPFITISFFGQTESETLAASMSGGEMVFLLFYLSVGILAAITGVFPSLAKLIVGFILLINGLQLFDILKEGSGMRETIELLGIDIFRMRDADKLLEILSIGAYTLAISLFLMIPCLFLEVEKRGDYIKLGLQIPTVENENVQTSGYFVSSSQVMKRKLFEIKVALERHKADSSILGFKNGVEEVKKAAKEKSVGSGFSGVFSIAIHCLGYVWGYVKAIFTTNILGKGVIAFAVLVIYKFLL